MARFLSPAKVASWEPTVRGIATELVDLFAATGGGDFVAALAVPLPVRVIAWLLRIPAEDDGRLKEWSNE